jgi:tripartite-type tricarboxylate transporter receptor subunit TctC
VLQCLGFCNGGGFTMGRFGSLLGLTFLMTAPRPVAAQEWPNHAVTMVVGFAAGGGIDILGRIVARKLAEVWVSRS